MMYFTLFFSVINVFIKRFGRLLLALPFFMLLIGCDSSSSTTSDTDNSTVAQTASVDSAQNTAESRQNNDGNNNANSDNESSGVDEGQSLISAAKVGDGAQTQRTPMISGTRNNSTLQATLIGDYIGMLPCLFCDDIDITLNLFADGSMLKTSVYNNPESPKVPLVESGIYRQDGNTITIVYENKNIETYRIQDNHLVMLDKDKNPNADYTLSRK
ncbi:copper resistance protein NlpE [Psychrobacter sp. 72-O-c]|uniref:copper resistance protein NlpE n=1 Tax=Psychrobacter sp. 72-O-c TaxID=2774125 RepID=UPI001917D428|nr:copper resistance protein NlpE [Psychrobacter sp. 72-O-c]